MSAAENVKKKLSNGFNAVKAVDRKLDETKVGHAFNRGGGGVSRGIAEKMIGKEITPHTHAMGVATDAGWGAIGIAVAVASGGILAPVVGGALAAYGAYTGARAVNDWRKDRKPKNPPSV